VSLVYRTHPRFAKPSREEFRTAFEELACRKVLGRTNSGPGNENEKGTTPPTP
jgi:hypothetical protein